MKKWFLVFMAMFVCSAQANVEVQFSQDVEILAVNGVDDIGSGFGHVEAINLENGQNQLLVRVGKLIRRSGQKVKYKSHPVVILFSAQDTSLFIEPNVKIETGVDGDNFTKNPVFNVSEAGNSYPVETDVLLGSALGFTRDYESELANYNKREAPASSFIFNEDVQLQQLNNEQRAIVLKAEFLRLSTEKREEFLVWANKQ